MDSENGHLNGSPGSSIRCEKKPLRKEVGSGARPEVRVATRRARDGVPTGGRHSVPYRVACEDLKPFNLEASRRVLPAFRYVKPNRLGHLSLR